jgi:hypothetical protein
VPQAARFPGAPPSGGRNDEPHAGGRAILNSEALRLEIRSDSPALLEPTAAAGKASGDVNFVPVQVSTAIFVAGGAVSSASRIPVGSSCMQRYIGGMH